METILMATDFSEASRNASVYGIELAKAIGAKIVLLNVYPSVVHTAENGFTYSAAELEKMSKDRLAEEVEAFGVDDLVWIEKRCAQGDVADQVVQVAEDVHASWIVAGMTGGNKVARKLFGGTAFSLCHHSTVPVILVPESGSFKPPKVIALASDIQDKTDMHILDPLKKFGETFNASLCIVRVIKKDSDDVVERLSIPGRIKWLLKTLHPSFEFLNDNDVAHAMNNFVAENNVDMVAMVSHEHNLVERIFVKSNIREMIIHTQVPLIIIPGKVVVKEIPSESHLEKEIL